MYVQGAYFVENYGAGIYATTGITLVEQSGFENNAGAGAWVGGSSTFLADTFSTHGTQKVGIAGTLNGGKVISIGSGNEYYGGGSDPTAYMNLQGSGTLSIVGSGKVIAGFRDLGDRRQRRADRRHHDADGRHRGSHDREHRGLGHRHLGRDRQSQCRRRGHPDRHVQRSRHGERRHAQPRAERRRQAAYSSGSGSTALVFSHTVQAGQNVADLAVTSLALNGATVKDTAGNLANTVAAAGYNPAGTLRIDTTVPTVSSIAASGPTLTAGGGTVGVGATVIFTVAMSEAVSVTGTPSLSLSSGGKATYTGGSGSGSLVFTHTVTAGQSAADLSVTAFNLEGGTVSDVAGNAASLSGATNYNPAGTLKVDTSTPSAPPPASVTQGRRRRGQPDPSATTPASPADRRA